MKLKLLVKLGEWILGSAFSLDEPRADLFLPIRILALSLALLVAGAVMIVVAVLKASVVGGIGAVGAIALGIGALLCWKNQKIQVISEETFEYTTFLGNKKTYHFRDITGLFRNKDSMTLMVAGEKVHMESSAIISDRLAEAISKQLKEIYGEAESE
jgi:hypothetical protein